MSNSSGKFELEYITTIIAGFAAVTFCYGYVFQYSYYREFGIGWWVEQLSVSSLALSGAPAAILLISVIIPILYIVDTFEKTVAALGVLLTVCYMGSLWVAWHLDDAFHQSASATLEWAGYVKNTLVAVSALAVALAFDRFKAGKLFLGTTASFFAVTLFILVLPKVSAQIRAVSIITQKESILPSIGSGENAGWSILGVNSSQAVLVRFDGGFFEKKSRIKFSSLDNVEIKSAGVATYQRVPE